MIKDNVEKILKELPQEVLLVAATKKRAVQEIQEAICAGVGAVGENYIQEAEKKQLVIGRKVKWHLIGHLQKNKAKHAVKIFDIIETLDSVELAEVLDKECKKINKVMPVLIEVNCAREPQKSGVFPEKVEEFLKEVIKFDSLKLTGLMTMGPFLENPQNLRPFFSETKGIFDRIKNSYGDRLQWRYLSMGMSDSYRVAIEEGANIIRIGTAIFGPRGEEDKDYL